MTSGTESGKSSTEWDERTAPRFQFGRNWQDFVGRLDERNVADATDSIRRLLRVNDLRGLRFLDAGSGSGLFSLGAHRLGAQVVSFDFDSHSVAGACELRRRFGTGEPEWEIMQGSLLDAPFLQSLGTFDVVYCWGVVHHTGRMWEALANVLERVGENGRIVFSVYNDQGFKTRQWTRIKSLYQRLPRLLQPVLVGVVAAWQFLSRFLWLCLFALISLVRLQNPLAGFRNWMREERPRGMRYWNDLVDWVGGWPFEAARADDLFVFVRDRGFRLREMRISDGHGCHEFVFQRESGPPAPPGN